ncbi:hypothetical protein I7E32_13105 [Alcaligenes faecalis]|uniref:hypothetical protein n=1 Tax=Alcaligenes faecalis TaxID=511 RepID=UPI0018D1A2AA|nr:hypothetical protein [Alcaligenes faecalis]MBH0311303.1 hypothetical protein [Alcaligenes faecalis]
MEDRLVEITVRRSIDELQAEFALASKFLVAFMWLERTLLINPDFRQNGIYAISWSAVKQALRESGMNVLPDCLHPLCTDPPKTRGADGKWKRRQQGLVPTLANALECLRRMRNNLAHGSKSEGAFDRNNELLNEGLKVLAYIDSEGIARRLVKN